MAEILERGTKILASEMTLTADLDRMAWNESGHLATPLFKSAESQLADSESLEACEGA